MCQSGRFVTSCAYPGLVSDDVLTAEVTPVNVTFTRNKHGEITDGCNALSSPYFLNGFPFGINPNRTKQ